MQVDNGERSFLDSKQFITSQSIGVPERKLPSTQPPSYYGVHMTSYSKQQTNSAPFNGCYDDRSFGNEFQGRCDGNPPMYQQIAARGTGEGIMTQQYAN